MCCLGRKMTRPVSRGVTLVELVLVMVVSAILFVTTPILIFHGVKTLVFLPKALAANTVANEAMTQVVEGGFSTLQSAPVRGLRCAIRTVPTGDSSLQPAIWLAEASRIGFLTSDGQRVLIRLDNELIKRSLPPSTLCPPTIPPVSEEVLPYQAQGVVRITTAGSLFQYYNQSGAVIPVPPGCGSAAAVRRIDITFTAQTGNGQFDQGNAQETITSSAAVRVP